MSIRWGLSVLDWRSHAIDERRHHPTGVYVAECGHSLMMVTKLHDRPNGRPCEACAALQLARAEDATASAGTDTATCRGVHENLRGLQDHGATVVRSCDDGRGGH